MADAAARQLQYEYKAVSLFILNKIQKIKHNPTFCSIFLYVLFRFP